MSFRGSSLLAIASLSLLLWVATATFWSAPASAVPAAPDEITLEQPDGETIEAKQFGDEFSNGLETTEGYTIVRNPETEEYEYAEEDAEGELQPSGTRADEAPPADIEEGLRPELPRGGDAPRRAQALEDPELATPNTGSQKNLVLLVQFADQSSIGSTPAQWSDKFFGSTNSVRDYYDEVSYGNLSMDPVTESNGTANDGVVGWLTLNQNHPNTAGNIGTANRLLTRDAINAANQYVNYASYDANSDGYISAKELHVTIIVAGYEAATGSTSGKSVWGHNWALYGSERPNVDGVVLGDDTRGGGYSQFGEWHRDHMATLGIMVHELGHDLDLPDLYDTDQSSEGVGKWSVMGGGSWLYTAGDHLGSMPAHLDPFSKSYEGWLTPEKVSGSNLSTSIQQAETSATAKQLLDNPNGVDWTFGGSSGTGEYFLIENRQRVGYDAGLPGTGLLVWHIDETRVSDNTANATDTRRLVDVEEADGFGHLDSKTNRGDEGDTYPGSGKKSVFNGTSNPNSNLYSGSSSNVEISNISGSSSTMTATLATTTTTTGGGGDTVAPTVALTAPADGDPVSGTSVALKAEASDDTGVKEVRFYVYEDGAWVWVGIDTTARGTNGKEYSYTWDSTTVSDGTNYFYADARDAAGNVTDTDSRSITVDNSSAADTTAPTGTISINKGAAKTKSRAVTLSMSASDNAGGSGVSQMCVSNTSATCTAWETYAPTKKWSLSKGKAGKRTVYVQYKDKAGNVSGVFQNTIKYAP